MMSDMGNEPDEVQQVIHMMICNNEFDLEGLIAVSSASPHKKHFMPHRGRVYPELFHEIIDALKKAGSSKQNVIIESHNSPKASFLVPALSSGQSIRIILELKDINEMQIFMITEELYYALIDVNRSPCFFAKPEF